VIRNDFFIDFRIYQAALILIVMLIVSHQNTVNSTEIIDDYRTLFLAQSKVGKTCLDWYGKPNN
jgi:hypothetical protein